MSKLTDAIRPTIAERRRPHVRPLNMATITEFIDSPSSAFGYRQEYRIEARIGATAWLDPAKPSASAAAELEGTVRSVKRAVIEEVFGEFRMPLAKLDMALWNEDTEAARALVSEIKASMFDL